MPKKIESYAEYKIKMDDYIDHLKYIVGKKGQPCPINCLIVSGEKGVGKTHQAKHILNELRDIRKSKIFDSTMSAVELYRTLWQYNDYIIVLDDINNIIMDKNQGASLLKAAAETRCRRTLHWKKQNPNCIHVEQDDPVDNEAIAIKMKKRVDESGNKALMNRHRNGETFPDMFFFTGALIILTNKPLSVIDKATEGALGNRSWHQEMLFEVDGAVDLIKNIAPSFIGHRDEDAPTQEPLSKESVDKAVSLITLDECIKQYNKYDTVPTIRTLLKIAREIQDKRTKITLDTVINNTEPRVP